MKTMVDNLACVIGGEAAKSDGEALKKEIDWVENFHKVNFSLHLGLGSSRCTCLHCGFHDKIIDPIECFKCSASFY